MNCRTKSRAWCSDRVGEKAKEGRSDAVGQRRKERRRGNGERDIKVFRVAKVAAAAATSKRPPTAGLWLRLSARVLGCVCVRSCTRSRLSRERSSRGGWLGFDGASIPVEPVRTLGRVRARSPRVCVLRPSLCTRANVRVWLYTRAFPPCIRRRLRSLHGKDNVAASFQTPWNDRVAASPRHRLHGTFPFFFLPLLLFLTPPLVSSFYSSLLLDSEDRAKSHDLANSRETSRKESAFNRNTMNPDEIFLVIFNHRVLVESS